jgi:hypothetical protein
VYFESTLDDQFDAWVSKFTPESQFGFVRESGTDDYGAALACGIIEHVNSKGADGRRGEGILISLDVAGAFDRCWWARLKARLRAKGMSGSALRLLYSYLSNRFIQVVRNGEKSTPQEIFSGVPQGAKWSPKLWDLDISEMECWISKTAMLICYADDSGLWYPITDENRSSILQTINQDLQSLSDWAKDNKTTFEPTKTHFTLISNRTSHRFDPTGIMFENVEIERKAEVKLVGYIFDGHMTWSTMLEKLYKKARSRMGMLVRLRSCLNNKNMETMYTSFVRPIMEYGSLAWMGAAVSHLEKLDSVQEAAMKIGRFKVESLASRRDAAAAAFACKLLDGKGRGVLKLHVPKVLRLPASRVRSKLSGIQLVNRVDSHSLANTFDRSFIGCMHGLWAKLPDDIKIFGDARGWLKVRKLIKLILVGKLDWNTADTDEKDSTTSKRVAYVKRISNEIKNKASK